MSEKLNINQWAEEDRPREKMATLGAEALSSAELLAILIGSGSTKESAVDLMKRILADCNNSLNTLGKKSIHDLCQYNGVGEAKAITILAACELGKRRQMETPEERPDLGTATRIYNHMHPVMQGVLGTAAKPAIPIDKKTAYCPWRHYRNSSRYSPHHPRGSTLQRHTAGGMSQPPIGWHHAQQTG